MHDAPLVRGDQRVSERDRKIEQLRERQSAGGNECGETLPLHQLHGQESSAVVLLDGVQYDDVRVVEPRDGRRLALETGEAVGRRRHVRG